MEPTAIVVSVSGRSLTDDENERVRAAVRTLLAKHDDNQSVLAPKIGYKQPSLSSFLQGRNGAGYKVARKVADLIGLPLDQLLSGKTARQLAMPRFDTLPGWAEAVAQARAIYKKVPPYAFEVVGGWMGATPPSIDPITIGNLARDWWESSSDMERSEALIAQAQREMTEEDELHAPANDTRPTKKGRGRS